MLLSISVKSRPEAILRLGYALLLKGDLASAQKSLEKAYAAAKAPGDWRTRARAKFDLGRIALRQGKKDDAKKRVAEAFAEGMTAKKGATGEEAVMVGLFGQFEMVFWLRRVKGGWRIVPEPYYRIINR